mgnify:CR=1 FL=1
MSCVVRDVLDNKYYYFCKGSPEIIHKLVKDENMPEKVE